MIENLFLNKRILIAVAHNDDVEFIAGGTLNLYHEQINKKQTNLMIITFASRKQNTSENFEQTLEQQQRALKELAVVPTHIENYQFRARFLPSFEDDIRKILKKLKYNHDPNIVITHYQNDPNQDHASVCQQVLRVFTDRTVLGGEISNTGKKLQPVLFVGMKEESIKAKVRALSCYEKESHKYYFASDLILSLAKVRAGQSGCFDFAEAFELYSLQTGIPLNR